MDVCESLVEISGTDIVLSLCNQHYLCLHNTEGNIVVPTSSGQIMLHYFSHTHYNAC